MRSQNRQGWQSIHSMLHSLLCAFEPVALLGQQRDREFVEPAAVRDLAATPALHLDL